MLIRLCSFLYFHSLILIYTHLFAYIFGCFYATKAKLSICHRCYMAHEAKNICYLILYTKSLLTSTLGKYNHPVSYKFSLNPDGSILSELLCRLLSSFILSWSLHYGTVSQ